MEAGQTGAAHVIYAGYSLVCHQVLRRRCFRIVQFRYAQDHLCGMTVVEGQEAVKSDYKGTTYYFCSRGCKVAFDIALTRYVNDDSTLKPGAQITMGHGH